MLGLDNAGKTSILYHLKLDQHVATTPTLGSNCECIEFNNLRLNVWDVGGQERIRTLWRHYYEDVNGIIFVIDSADPQRFAEARQELEQIVSDVRLEGLSVLVLANKEDIQGSVTVAQLAKELDICRLMNGGGGRRSNSQTDLTDVSFYNNNNNNGSGQQNSYSGRKFHIQSCCAITGDGLLQGLEWLSHNLEMSLA